MLGQAQVIRTAAQEELEAHRIYVEAARLNAESHEVLVRARARLAEPPQDQFEECLPILELTEKWQEVDETENSSSISDELGAIREIASKATKLTVKPKAASNGKKPARKVKSAG